ncbi:DNA translocase FtsK, partial [Streptomyces roseoviridis]
LTRLTKKGKLHRQLVDGKEVRGYYGLGAGPRTPGDADGADGEELGREVNELLPLAIDLVVTTQHASAAMLQRKLRASWETVQGLLSVMEQTGIVSPAGVDGHRDVLADADEYTGIVDQARRDRPAE